MNKTVRGLAFGLAALLPALEVRASAQDALVLERTLAELEQQAPRGADAALVPLLARLEGRDAARQREFAAAGKELPKKAADRLAQARAAYDAGQGRLLALLREIARGQGTNERSARIQEARELAARLAKASRQEALSAELKLRAPSIAALPLLRPSSSSALEPPAAPIGPVPAPLRAMADTLAGPIEVYAWVRNNIKPEFYYGSMKGPLQAFLDRSGNDADTAAVLVGLLRAKGIPARFVQGLAQVDAQRLQAVTGTTTREQAVRVLQRAGIPYEVVPGPAGGIAAVKAARVWAEAYVPYVNYRGLPLDAQGKLWIPLDAGFKDLAPPGGRDVFGAGGLDPDALVDEYLQAPQSETPREFLRSRATSVMLTLQGTYPQALNDRSLQAQELGILPNVLPFKLAGPADRSYDTPLPHLVRVHGEWNGTTLIDATLSLPDVLGQRVTLSYVPFDDDDARTAAQYGGLTRTPPYLIEVKPLLKVGGIVAAVGEAPIGAAVTYDLHVTLSAPAGSEDVHNRVLAGNLMAIGLAGANDAGVEQQNEQAAALLARAAFQYLRRWNQSDAELADLFHVVPVRPTASACFVMSDVEVEYAGGDALYPVSFDWKGVAVDADLRSSAPVGVERQDAERGFTLVSGLEGSILENRLFEDLWQVGSVSTAKALQLAAQQGLGVLTLTRDNVDADLPGLPLDPQVKEEIRDAALRGFSIRVPVAPVSYLAWTGAGWWILDEETGESAWQLQGGHSGGVTAAAAINWPDQRLVETLVDQGEAAAPPETPVAQLRKFVSTDFQEGTVNKQLTRPFRVMAIDVHGQRVPKAPVTFQVMGGGGSLVDPATGRGAEGALTVLANARGEAEATLVLGKRTDEIPRYACLEPDPESCSADNEVWGTQIGLNLVTAISGPATLAEPFTSYGKPDDQFDGTFRHARLSSHTWPQGDNVWNLSVAGLFAVNVRDPYGNPISNYRVRFAYRPPPQQGTPPPSWHAARPPTDTPGKLLRAKDYAACLEHSPSPRWGECPGEHEELFVPSSTSGSVVYPVLGDSPYSYYVFDIGTDEIPSVGSLPLGTWGYLCQVCDRWESRWPNTLIDIDARNVLFGRRGEMIEAYAPGASAEMRFTAQALYEDYDVQTSVDEHGTTRYHVTGNNHWTREPLDDSVFTLTPRTPGTGSGGTADPVGNGAYSARMVMAGTPQLNSVRFASRNMPLLIPQNFPDHPDEVDPHAVDPATLRIQKRKFPDRPWPWDGSFSLWGARASIQAVDPSPIRVDGGRVAATALVAHRVEPPEYLAVLDPTEIWFTLARDGGEVLAATGSDGSPFQIPQGMAFPAGDYTGKVIVPSVSRDGHGIESAPYTVPTCEGLELLTPTVLLPQGGTPPQAATCQHDDKLRFKLCGRSAVTLLVGEVPLEAFVDGASRTLDGLELAAGTHVVEVPRDLLERLHAPSAPFLLRATGLEAPQVTRAASGAIVVADELLALETPIVKLTLSVDRQQSVVCGDVRPMLFAVCQDAKVTVKVEGTVLAASLDGGPVVPLDGVTLAAGAHDVRIQPSLLGTSTENQKAFHIDAQALADANVHDEADGRFESSACNRAVVPVGRTFVKGVDLFDGHLARQEVDFSLPGRHLGLEMSRAYSSSGSDSESPLGAGWSWNYAMSLHVAECGLVVLSARDGTQMFHGDIGTGFTPEPGYHGRLVKGADGAFDYTDKAGVLHHFVQGTFDPTEYRLEYIRDPHGDRLVLEYDLSGHVTRVFEEQDGTAVREIRLTYAQAAGYPRVVRAEAWKGTLDLHLRVDYEYDEQWGNLTKATRRARNLGDGPRPPDRVQTYAYSVTELRDPHQLTEVRDANRHVTRYQYYARREDLPGEAGLAGAFFVPNKEERVRAVYEYPDARELVTRFDYDLRESTSARWKTTVRDAAGRETLYVQNGNGGTLEVHEPLGKTTRTTWTDDVRKETETDANGRVTRFTWDGNGNIASGTVETNDASLGDVATSATFDQAFNKPTSETDALGHTRTWTVNAANGDVTAEVDAEGNRTTLVYDGGAVAGPGLLTSKVDARGNATTYGDHTDFGQPRSVRDALGNETRRTFDERGRVLVEEDDFGRRTELEYDGLDRVMVKRRFGADVAGRETTFTEYYPDGQVAAETNSNGARTVYTLDGLERVTRVDQYISGRVLRAETHYDDAGNKDRETDRRGVVRVFVYDDLNRLKQVLIDSGPSASPSGQVAAFDYDLVGNKRWERDIAGLQTDFEYDGLYRVTAKLQPETMPAGYLPSGRLAERAVFDKVGNRTSAKDANGHETRVEYDRLRRPTRMVKDPDGLNLVSTVRYCNAPAADPADGGGINKCEEHDESKGLRTLFEYDELNRESARTVRLEGPDGDPAIDEYVSRTEYEDGDHRVRVTDANGRVSVTTLDGLDRVISQVVDDGGLALETLTSYDGLGNKTRVVDARGSATKYEYDGLGRLTRQTDALNQSSAFDYDEEGLRTAATDRRGVRQRTTYDNLGRATRVALETTPFSGVGSSHETEYRDTERVRIEKDARGKATTYKLDGLGRVIEERDAAGKTAFSKWDGVNKVEQTDKRPAHNVTKYEYDALNRQTKVTDPALTSPPTASYVFSTRYLDAQNQVEGTDRRGWVKRTQLDALGRVRSVTDAVGRPEEALLERNAYDGLGNKTLALDAESRQTRFEYDGANRLSTRTDGYGGAAPGVTRMTYDANGNLEEEQDQRARDLGHAFSTKRVYDVLNRVTDEYDSEGNHKQYTYDAEGNRTSAQEPKGARTTLAHDEQGKLLTVTQTTTAAGVPVTRHAYDENRNHTSQTDANSHAVTMEYDDLNRLAWLNQPGAIRTHHEYDENGSEVRLTDPNGNVEINTYDELNRLRVKEYTYVDGLELPWRRCVRIEYTYDGNGNVTEVREDVASGTSPPVTFVTTRVYDALDRLTSETSQTAYGQTVTVGYTYYRNGLRKTVTDATGAVTLYTYDDRNRLQTVTAAAGTPEAKTTMYTYWPDDLLKDATSPNGVKAAYMYDRADRLKILTNTRGATVVSSYGYDYDRNGNRERQVEVNGGLTETTTYAYDALDRLERVTYPVDGAHPSGRTVTYGYDLVGNRTREREVDGASVALSDKAATFDELNRLLSVDDSVSDSNDATFTYDRNGNQRTKTTAGVTTAYVYDAKDMLVETRDSAHGATPTARFQYDAQGRRVLKVGDPTASGDSGTVQFVYDQSAVIEELDAAGAEKAKYAWGGDRLVSLGRVSGSLLDRRYYSFDGLGTVSNLTDDSGTAQASYHLDAWGNYRFPAELDSSPNRFGFTGHYWDTETSLYYAKARYFDPEYGRFTTQDSVLGQLDSPPSLHRYFYANDNPTRYVDPSGHSAVDEWWAGATTFAKEFGTGVFELGANSLSFGGYSGVKRAYQSGDIDLSHPAQAAFRAWQHNAAAVLNKASFGFVEGAVDARSQGKGALGTIGGGTVGVADNFAPISETQTWNDSKASGWDKAEALATGTVKLAGTLIGAKGLLSKGSAITGTIAESRTALVPTRAAAAADSEALVSIERSATSAMPNTRHLAQVADVDELDALLVRLSERSVRHGAAARTAGMSGVKAGNLAETYLERYAAMVNERLSRYSSPFVVESQPAMLEGYGRVPSLIQYPGGQTRPFPDSLRLDLGLSDTRQMVGTPAVSEDLFPTLLRGYDITLNSAKVDAAVKYEPFGVKIRDIRPKAQ